MQNSELFTLTYGALVSQLIKDHSDNVEEVNKQLERMGYNIGIRIIEDFLARTNAGRCYDFRDTAEKVQVCKPCFSLGFVFIMIQQTPVTAFLIEINTVFLFMPTVYVLQ